MKKAIATLFSAALLGSLALADGFSLTANLQAMPQLGLVGGLFSTPYRSYRGSALNYTSNLTDNIVVGGSLRPGFFGGTFALSSRVGGVAVYKLNESDTGYVEGALRLGSNQSYAPGGFLFDFDLGAEVFLTQRVADAAVLYGGVGLTSTVVPSPFLFTTALNGYLGTKLELTPDLAAYLEGGVLYPLGGTLGYDASASLYYTLFKGARLGVYTGYLAQGGAAGAFKLGLGFEWTEKPETLGTPGNYLP